MIAGLALLLAAAAPAVARVGGEAITVADVRARVDALRATGGPLRGNDIVEQMIAERLLAQEGRARGLQDSAEVRAAFEAERVRLAVRELLEPDGAPAVTEAQVLEAYHRSGDAVRIDVALLSSRAAAEAVLDRLRRGAPFPREAASAHSGDPGLRTRADLDPALREPAFAAPPQAAQGPVQVAEGWAVFRVRAREPADEAGLRERREALRDYLEQRARAEVRAHVVERIRPRAAVKLDEAFLVSTGSATEAKPAEAARVVARVFERRLLYGDVLARMRSLGSSSHGGAALKVRVAQDAADDLLLQHEALARHGRDPQVLRGARNAADAVLAQLVAQILRSAAPQPTPAEVEAFYRMTRSSFSRPARRACAHLVVGTLDEARVLKQRLESGEEWAKLVRERSLDRATAANGGAIGELDEGHVRALIHQADEPELAQAVLDAAPGRYAGPARSRKGYHLVRCGPQLAAGIADLDEVRADIAARLAAGRGDDAVRAELRSLRERAAVEIDPALAAQAVPGGPTP